MSLFLITLTLYGLALGSLLFAGWVIYDSFGRRP